MSEAATAFVDRHRLFQVNRTKGLVLMVLAFSADDVGRARMTQGMVATKLGAAPSTIKKSFQSLLRAADGGPFIVKGRGRTYVITGVAEHDLMTCLDVECAAEAQSIRAGATSARKRRLAAERARRARERQKAARQAAQTV